jgi:GR25 family glycosyltransferase involved in LPS biosynthesis
MAEWSKDQPNLFKMPTYLINMDERKDRLKRFMGQDSVRYMTRIRRLRAANGQAINEFKKDKRISLRTRYNIVRNYRRSHHEIATLGAVGASLSHIDLWKRFVASGEPYCMVFEDDARVKTELIHKVHRVWPTLPKSWGIWLLGYYEPTMTVEALPEKPWNRVVSFSAAHAYIIKRETAQALLEDAFPIEMHIDHYMAMCGMMKDFKLLQHPDIYVPFWGFEDGPRINDSNTSQHKKRGCTVCKVPDDHGQLYRKWTHRGKKGLLVKGIIDGQQSNEIRMLRRTRKRV